MGSPAESIDTIESAKPRRTNPRLYRTEEETLQQLRYYWLAYSTSRYLQPFSNVDRYACKDNAICNASTIANPSYNISMMNVDFSARSMLAVVYMVSGRVVGAS